MRRIARTTGVRYTFFTPNKLCSLYTAKDRLPTDSISSAVYSVKCRTCSGEYVGETLRALDAIRLGQSSKHTPSISMNSRCHMKSMGAMHVIWRESLGGTLCAGGMHRACMFRASTCTVYLVYRGIPHWFSFLR